MGLTQIGAPVALEEFTVEAAARSSGGWLWLHLNLGEPALPPLARPEPLTAPRPWAAEFAGPSFRQHFPSHGEYLFGHLNDFPHEFDRTCTEQAISMSWWGFYIALGPCLLSLGDGVAIFVECEPENLIFATRMPTGKSAQPNQ